MKLDKIIAVLAALVLAPAPALAQWQVQEKQIPVGRGSGAVGFTSVGGANCVVNTDGASNPQCTSVPSIFDNAYCNTVGYLLARLTSQWTCVQQIPINVAWLGADKTGAADSTTIIQNAITALGTTGGIIEFEPGTYKISSTLNIGNGTTSAGSTRNNIRLRGLADPKTTVHFPGYVAQTGGVTIQWAGAGAATMISINGPLQGWGLDRLYIDCNSTANIGVSVKSAQFGSSEKLTIAGCRTAGYFSTTVPHFGSFSFTDSYRNSFRDMYVVVPDIVGAKGVWLTGGSIDSNTDYNTFYNLGTDQLGASATFGLYLQATDGNLFYLYNPLLQGFQTPLAFDYTLFGGQWPAGNFFYGVEGAPVNIGTPGSLAVPNYFSGMIEDNGNVYPTTLPNAMSALPNVITQMDLVAQSASIAATNISPVPPYKTGLYRINYYLAISTTGTSGTITPSFFWGDGVSTKAFTGAAVNVNGTNYTQGAIVIYNPAGSNISYSVAFGSVVGAPRYMLRTNVEKMN